MSNVPSTAIIAIFGIVAACILVSLMVSVVMSQRNSMNNAAQKVAEADVSNHTDEYLKLAGTTMTGDSVLSILKVYIEEPIVIMVDGYSYNFSGNTLSSSTQKDLKTREADYAAAKNKSASSGHYINPATTYKCSLEFDTNGNIKTLVFTQ